MKITFERVAIFVLAVLLLGAVIRLHVTSNNPPEQDPKSSADAISVIHSRKSVRKYTEQQVSKEQLETAIRAAMAAPTARNQQPWRFVVITQKEALNQLAEVAPNGKMLKEASAAIIVCGDSERFFPGEAESYWVQDCSASNQNLLLAIESMGLGAVWIGVHPISERINALKNVVELPPTWQPLCINAIGYPTGAEKPKNKWKPENILWK